MKYSYSILLILFTQLFTLSLQAEELTFSIEIVPRSQRYALLIGVNDYPKEKALKKLPSAVKDMTDLADALEKYADFPRENITLMTDDSPEELLPTLENIQNQVEKTLSQLSEDDLLIVAFSGHGVTIDYGKSKKVRPYFCVRDTDLPDTKTLLSRDWLFKKIDSCKSKKKIFICDACRTLYTKEAIMELAPPSEESPAIHTLQYPSESWGYNYILMSSCSKGQNAIDTGTNGLFTKYLIEGLSTNKAALRDGDLTAHSWYEYAAKQTAIVSAQMVKENPMLVKGTENQTRQEPQFKCQGEMGYFLITKLDPVGPDDRKRNPPQLINPGQQKILEADGIKYAFRWCPPGEFVMGSANGSSDEKPAHTVKMTRGFWLLETEVTQEMWFRVTGRTQQEQNRLAGFLGDKGTGPNYPVYRVNWDECQDFCQKLSMKLNKSIQLPTEAQWEYACRAGSTGYFIGDLGSTAWYDINANSMTHEVAQKQPNSWGLYDMLGNVWEWCSDYYEANYYVSSPESDPENTAHSSYRVNRGGSIASIPDNCRPADRSRDTPDYRNNGLGLRVVLLPDPDEE